jgi:hypothetical protein
MAFSKYRQIIFLIALFTSFSSIGLAQDPDEPSPSSQDKQASVSQPDPSPSGVSYSFSGEVAGVSNYIWRGQRLTNDWSLQPSGTLGIGDFSINFWGNLDLTSVNEGDSLYLPENPDAPPGGGHAGLRGQFSEVDITMSYALYAGPASFDVGTIIYTFPNRSASLPTTVELYGGFSLDDLFLAPGATLYVDVNETGKAGSTGLYFLADAGHMFLFGHSRFPGLEISGSLGIANNGFSQYYYGADQSGFHDVNVTLSLPISLSEHWSAGAFISYSALLGDFRDDQYRDLRDVYLNKAGSPVTYADTIWGGVSLSLSF